MILLINCLILESSLASSVLFRYDLVDVTREAMGVGCQVLNRHIVDAHKAKSIPKVKAAGKKMVELLLDLDKVLGSDGHFLLGKWINDARKIGTNEEEKKLLEFNARAQVTTWGRYMSGPLGSWYTTIGGMSFR
jgi:alpha-N-acetylglucosaminidase